MAGNGECVELIGGKQKEEKKTLTHNTERERRAREVERGCEKRQLEAGRDVDHNNTKVKLVENANTNKKKEAKQAAQKTALENIDIAACCI